MTEAPYPSIHSPGSTRFDPFPPVYPPGWRPKSISEFNVWNVSRQGTFPSVLVGPGQNPDPLPHSEPRHPFHTGATPTNPFHAGATPTNPGKRKRAAPIPPAPIPPTPIPPGVPSSVGGYGPLPPGETVMGPSPPGPPPPGSHPRRNGAYDVWAFARPLGSNDILPASQWPASLESHLTSKPKSTWFGCILCTQFGYVFVPASRVLC